MQNEKTFIAEIEKVLASVLRYRNEHVRGHYADVILRAKKLLKSTDMKSADIAYKTGFNDPHYFSFIFKKVTGLSPREYRTDPTNDTYAPRQSGSVSDND